jgi:hypothetical protein
LRRFIKSVDDPADVDPILFGLKEKVAKLLPGEEARLHPREKNLAGDDRVYLEKE